MGAETGSCVLSAPNKTFDVSPVNAVVKPLQLPLRPMDPSHDFDSPRLQICGGADLWTWQVSTWWHDMPEKLDAATEVSRSIGMARQPSRQRGVPVEITCIQCAFDPFSIWKIHAMMPCKVRKA